MTASTLLTPSAALAASHRAELRGRLRIGLADLYTWVFLAGIGIAVLAGVHLRAVGPSTLHLVMVSLRVAAPVIGAAWALYLARPRWASTPFRFSVAEVHLLLMAPMARADLYRAVARRWVIRLVLAVLAGAGVLALVGTASLGSHGPLAFLGPLGALSSLAAGWVWSGYGHHASGLVRAAVVGVSVILGLLGLVQPLARLPAGANPLGLVVRLGVVPAGLSTSPATALALGLVVVGALALVMAVIWVPRVPIEAIARRAPLVSQLRFALARGDTRAVSILARLGSGDSARARPWASWRPDTVGARGAGLYALVSVATRTPASRLARLGLLVGLDAYLVHLGSSGPARFLVALLVGLVGYLIGLSLLEPVAGLIDRAEAATTGPASQQSVLVTEVAWTALASVFVMAVMTYGTPVLVWPATALALAVVALVGPLLSLVLGPPSPEFLTQLGVLGVVQPVSALVLGVTRYSIGVLVSVAGTATALRLATLGGAYPLGVVVALLALGLWAVRKVGPRPRGDRIRVVSWVAFAVLGMTPIGRDNAPQDQPSPPSSGEH